MISFLFCVSFVSIPWYIRETMYHGAEHAKIKSNNGKQIKEMLQSIFQKFQKSKRSPSMWIIGALCFEILGRSILFSIEKTNSDISHVYVQLLFQGLLLCIGLWGFCLPKTKGSVQISEWINVFLIVNISWVVLNCVSHFFSISLPGPKPITERHVEYGNVLLQIISSAVFAPIVEEILYRVLVLRAIVIRSDATTAIGISSVIFAFAHGNLFVIPFYILMGLIFGLTVVRFKKWGLMISITVHCLWNSSITLSAVLH